MTSKKVHVARLILALALMCIAAGCDIFHFPSPPIEPHAYASPYPATKLWAVVPFRNESGTSVADGLAFAEHLSQQLQQVPGIQIVPTNRVIAAMEASKLTQITTVDQAMKLIQTLDVDGVVVGTITAWDPYDPPKIGATIALFSAERGEPGGTGIDTRQLTASPIDSNTLPGERHWSQPVAQISNHFDAANGSVLTRLQAYATGRVPNDSPAGWRRYLISMDLYSEFVSHELMRRLFASEWSRLRPNTTAEVGARNAESKDSETAHSELRTPNSELPR